MAMLTAEGDADSGMAGASASGDPNGLAFEF
jgi:hypothetical protein